MLNEFTEAHLGYPARIFGTVAEAAIFASMLARMEISHRVILDQPPKRLKLPMRTIVLLLDTEYGVRH